MVVNVNEIAAFHLLDGLYIQKISALSTSLSFGMIFESNCNILCNDIDHYNTDQCVSVANSKSFLCPLVHQMSYRVSQILTADRLTFS